MTNSVNDLSVLARFSIAAIPKTTPIIITICWLHPLPSRLKINTDSATRSAPSDATAGGIIRDYYGHSLATFAAPLGVLYAFEAELFTVIIAVNKVSVMPSHPV